MQNSISHEFKPSELLRFALPSIFMMMFLSFYTIIDGLFLARYIGTDAFAAVNIAYPYSAVIFSIALMFGAGGSSIVANLLGIKRKLEARQSFSLIVLVTLIIIVVICITAYMLLDPLVELLGANPQLSPDVHDYLGVIIFFSVAAALQALFVSFFVTASRPRLGLIFTILAGLSNIVLDYVFIVELNFGVKGAALATGISYCIPAVGGLIFFLKHSKGLCLARPRFKLDVLKYSCINGSSEMTNYLSSCVVTFIFNITMMKQAGTDGVAAIGVILYCQFLLTALFIGFSIGVAPIFSYHYAAHNRVYLKKLLQTCLFFIWSAAVTLFILTYISSETITSIFAKPATDVFTLASTGLKIFAFSIIFSGTNIFASATLTAITKGRSSAIIALSRSLIFVLIGTFLFVKLFHTTGVWLAIPFSEAVTILIVTAYYFKNRTQFFNQH